MGRDLRPQIANGIYHVCSRGGNRRVIFRDAVDRLVFLTALAYVVRRHGWQVLAFSILGNHFHLLVRTPEANLSSGMELLLSLYARRFNARYGRSNQVFGGRFRHRLVEHEEHLLRVLRYIARNAPEAGLCRRPEEWIWSSHRATAGLCRRPAFLDLMALAGLLGCSGRRLASTYLAIVDDDGLVLPGSDLVALEL
jgi:REP element-mobilizing transposase RayT